MLTDELTVYDFQSAAQFKDWAIINDGVMGGLSQSEFIFSDSSTAIFQGTVSLANNGGFSSTRTKPQPLNLKHHKAMRIRVKGDGKKYQFRIGTHAQFDGITYRFHFDTTSDTWTTIDIPFADAVPVFRGRILENVEPISPQKIQYIGFLISDKQAGPFRLEIDWIKAYR